MLHSGWLSRFQFLYPIVWSLHLPEVQSLWSINPLSSSFEHWAWLLYCWEGVDWVIKINQPQTNKTTPDFFHERTKFKLEKKLIIQITFSITFSCIASSGQWHSSQHHCYCYHTKQSLCSLCQSIILSLQCQHWHHVMLRLRYQSETDNNWQKYEQSLKYCPWYTRYCTLCAGEHWTH